MQTVRRWKYPLIAAVVNWAYLVAILAPNHPTFPKKGALVSTVLKPAN